MAEDDSFKKTYFLLPEVLNMKNLTAASRITIGLVCSMVGILITANFLGLLPDQNVAITQGRAQLTESLAFSTSLLLSNNDRTGIEQILRNVAARQKQVRSIGVRRADGIVVVAVGDHNALWPVSMGDNSNASFMQVPLSHTSDGVWGTLEVSFLPLDSGRWYAFAENAQLQLLIFTAVSGFFSFRLFLRFVLKNLDPSRAVPRRVREALDILNEGLMIVSLDDRILLANNALAQTAQCSAESLVGRKAGGISLKRTDNSTTMPWTECGLRERPVSGVTMDFVDQSGQKRIFKVNCSPLFGNEGRIRGIMVSLDDVTQLEKNKVDLRIAKDEADAANKAKGDFLANMSHEIRNPMNAIVGFTDILRRGLEDSETTRTAYLDTIHASGTHLVELINDILDFSKFEAGKLELEICECNPYQLMNEVVNVLRMKAEQQSLSLSISLRGTIPETIHADSTRLRQILMNLVGNAIKFTAEGGVRILACMEEKDSQPYIRFEVTDTGIGMTRDQMSRLFQEFMQADSSVTRRFGGTGLGLAISKRLTEAMGGQIAVSSEPGVGSTFYFSIATGDLTGVQMLSAEQAAEKFRSASRTQQQGLRVYFKPARVLITDDTLANRQLAGLVLRKAGLSVDEAENGAIAVEKARSGVYDLLLMDMQMPVMDGFTATRTLREHGLQTPILAFTANVMEQDRQRCVAAGCSGFLAKPINIDLLLSTIAEYLETTDAPIRPSPQIGYSAVGKDLVNPDSAIPASTTISGSLLDEILDQIPGVPELPAIARKTTVKQNPATEDFVSKHQPIHSTLPLDIPEFLEIVESFVGCINDIMHSLRAAQARMDYQEVREIAHRLKGTGGTVGFASFTEPSRKLQIAAEERDDAAIDVLLAELEDISSRIELPAAV